MSKHEPEKTDPRRRPAGRPEQPDKDTESEPAKHQGATEEDVAPVTPPTEGSADPLPKPSADDEIDPSEELTPG
jgi:hypothetical protein